MACPSCGDDANPPGARFCENCGASLDAAAAGRPGARGCQCATPDFDADGFCRNCGMKAPKAAPAVEYEMVVDAALALASDRGRRHVTNQDFGIVARRDDGAALIVVADGVSASDNPEAASRAAARAAERAFLKSDLAGRALSAEAAALVGEAAAALMAMPIAERQHDGPASTIVIAIARPNGEGGFDAGIAWVGDSRAYIVAANVPEMLLTRDDSWAIEQTESGRMTQEEAMRSPHAHAISQWLGMPLADMVVHTRDLVLTPGASLLLCSDGLWNYADAPSALARAFTAAAKDALNSAAICRALVGFANAAGGVDNITIGLLRV